MDGFGRHFKSFGGYGLQKFFGFVEVEAKVADDDRHGGRIVSLAVASGYSTFRLAGYRLCDLAKCDE